MSRSNQLAGLLTADPPSALDTINEINTALGNDASLSATLTNSIATKASKSGDTFTGNVTLSSAKLEVTQPASDQSGGSAIKAIGTAYSTNKAFHAYMNTSNASKSLIYAENSSGGVFNVAGDGNVGIGTDDPRAKAEVYDSSVSGTFNATDLSTWRVLQIRNNIEGGSGTGAGIAFGGDGTNDTETAGIVGISDNTTGGVCQLAFITSYGNSSIERMRIDSVGKVAIGHTGPIVNFGNNRTTLTLKGGASGDNYSVLEMYNNSADAVDDNLGFISFGDYQADTSNASTENGRIACQRDVSNFDSGRLVFYTRATGGSLTERMRINHSGILLEGTDFHIASRNSHSGADRGTHSYGLYTMDIRSPRPTDLVNKGVFASFTSWGLNNTTPYADGLFFSTWSDSSGGEPNIMVIRKNGNGVKVARQSINSTTQFSSGQVYTLNYTSASDKRVKENVQNITGGLDSVLALRPVTYEWTDDYILQGHSKNAEENVSVQEEGQAPVIQIPETKTTNVGFIAQEVEEVIPTVVHQQNIRLATMEEGDFLKDIAYEKLVPHLVSAIQELSAKVTALENAS